jgi:hypothetical protein
MDDKKKSYAFQLPKAMSFDEIAREFIADYDGISEETKNHTLQVYASYACYGSPYFTNCGGGSENF